jgi:ABC-type transporter Mla subunit MlaD
LDEKEYAEFLQAQFELQAALQGVFNHIARNWIPVLGGVADVVSEVIGIYNLFVRELLGSEFTVQSVANGLSLLADILAATNRVLSRTIAFWKAVATTVNPLIGLFSRLADEEEKVAQARAQAAQAAAAQNEVERERQAAIQDTVESLNELRVQLVDKLSDIERDAAEKWDDILVKRQREAIDRARQEAFRLIDLQAAYNERLDAIEADFAKRWDDILVKRQRDAIVRGIRLAQRYEDLARAAERRRQDTLRDFEKNWSETIGAGWRTSVSSSWIRRPRPRAATMRWQWLERNASVPEICAMSNVVSLTSSAT